MHFDERTAERAHRVVGGHVDEVARPRHHQGWGDARTNVRTTSHASGGNTAPSSSTTISIRPGEQLSARRSTIFVLACLHAVLAVLRAINDEPLRAHPGGETSGNVVVVLGQQYANDVPP